MQNVLFGVIVALVLWFFIYVNFLDRCKSCGNIRTSRVPSSVCKHCKEPFVPKYPYLDKLTYILIPILIILFIVYEYIF